MGEFLFLMFIITFVISNIIAIFTGLHIIFERTYNIPMIMIMLYGFIGTLLVSIVMFILFIICKIEQTKFWQNISKMREI
ncbi:hypothetical protein vBValMR10Z_67 [Vibrio phage vB_ValM_R10Z]|nr:hypothetical protein Va3_029 [Vibrio phage Va3]QNJ54608.1 hypothetical protein vBValMR10Z_67 [Vibrio phage vB_ValM_R10Z]QNJ54993.1 hypothetical protein vBValMR11Z_67 [Vibrio phage vB_ValM_R11Z]